MINIQTDKIEVDLRDLSHSKKFLDLCPDETTAFEFGIYYPRVLKYLQNANIEKKNPILYKEINSLNIDTIDYIEPMTKLINDFIEDGDESFLGVCNYILNNLEYKEDSDSIKMSFILGIYMISGELGRIIKDKLDLKKSENNKEVIFDK